MSEPILSLLAQVWPQCNQVTNKKETKRSKKSTTSGNPAKTTIKKFKSHSR